jgi:hypothetical protein
MSIATSPEECKKIVRGSVDKDYFDQDIFDEMEKKYENTELELPQTS